MTRRRSVPMPNGSSHSSSNGTSNHGTGGRNLKSMKLILFLASFGCLYYYINLKERASIENSRREGTTTTTPVATAPGITNSFITSTTSTTLVTPDSPHGKSSPASDSQVDDPQFVNMKIPEARLQNKAKRKFFLEPQSEFKPAIAWLMSFPNSGTSYTMTMVARSSNKSFATNYAEEVMADDDTESLSIYPRRPEGPYWAGLSGKIATPRDLPDTYVLTKTHCGSRCLNCGPDEYVETPQVFLKKCASGHARLAPKRKRIEVEYPPNRVARAIHLIRNPFHNVIARYHLEHRHKGYSNKTDWLEQHPNDENGLQLYCQEMDKTYRKQDEEFFNRKNSNYRNTSFLKVPCHGEFYKWTQWHNLVHDSLALIEHDVPVLTVYYEDYSANFNRTVKLILDFLELEHVGVLREFSARSDYGGYFTKDQEAQIKSLVQGVAHEATWEQVKHYFD